MRELALLFDKDLLWCVICVLVDRRAYRLSLNILRELLEARRANGDVWNILVA